MLRPREEELAELIELYESQRMDEGEITVFFQMLLDTGLYQHLGDRYEQTVSAYYGCGIIH